MAMTNELCADIGYMSLNHADEQLCGDHVEVVEQEEEVVIQPLLYLPTDLAAV